LESTYHRNTTVITQIVTKKQKPNPAISYINIFPRDKISKLPSDNMIHLESYCTDIGWKTNLSTELTDNKIKLHCVSKKL